MAEPQGELQLDITGRECIMNELRAACKYIMQNWFLLSSVFAVFLGVAVGLLVKIYYPLSDDDHVYLAFPGTVLMKLLQLITVPLIMSSLIIEVCGPIIDTSRKIAMRVAVYFVLTTLISVCIGEKMKVCVCPLTLKLSDPCVCSVCVCVAGLILVLVFKPGTMSGVQGDDEEEHLPMKVTLVDLASNMMPLNIMQACFQQYKTEMMTFEDHSVDPNTSVETNSTEVVFVGKYVDGANILGLILYAFSTGMFLKVMGENGTILVYVADIVNEIMKYVINHILFYIPVGVFFMTASYVLEVHDWETMYRLGNFIAVVVIGLLIHSVIVLPSMYLLVVRSNPWGFIKGICPALLTALLVSSSSATLPLSLRCCEERNKMDRSISCFMLSIGTDINMNGTVLYQVIAAVFITQLNQLNLDLGQMITIAVMSAVSSVGAARIPANGAVTTLFVLTSVGLPAKEVSILVVVEWLLTEEPADREVCARSVARSAAFILFLDRGREQEELKEEEVEEEVEEEQPHRGDR
ncbi:Excitatory amino acid transporter 3 [Nibea albiflora]|uniref:Excitatory amino acid transporter 3 n=1 Tax=Nibea albiflora TaxID=240163 RepID=A0ACB7F1U2_NIBAL|nr:Excitatory amino acid transporter 3 [Nibea albiflora]